MTSIKFKEASRWPVLSAFQASESLTFCAVAKCLADRTARRMISSLHHNVVGPSITLCIVALRVGVDGQKFYRRVPIPSSDTLL